MNVIVTGGAGFIGSHLVDRLIDVGHEVHVFDHFQAGNINHVHPNAIIHEIDIVTDNLAPLFQKIRPDIVFHLAAQVDITTSVARPDQDAMVNIIATIRLLEASCQYRVKKFIFASSSAVYGEATQLPITEAESVCPISYYGLSKHAAEMYIKQFHRLYGLSYTILRYGNVYGPRQPSTGEGGVVAIFNDRIIADQPVYIYGDGEQTRDFVYVNDVVDANIASLRKGTNQTIQIGTNEATSVRQLVDQLEQIHQQQVEVIYKGARSGEVKNSCLDNQKAFNELSWEPMISIKDGLSRTYDYFRRQTVPETSKKL
ncbi:NAD-dependent epimerase/dehydratase [Gracilibacillus halophilus YIM-C55.5]|uniref:NAD-dependent epimerase/dehydratase n=1 Tax=Gracilibacillus halophilus YIM-C55.5 TaxID=1308866 RepID=N4W8L1_9BACI|nr:NAD-dependent epimerase/dehydratase family protein [Gracilibacillus halophilus]ENH96608.1 NAD-dependent epimerase/dehydratase [Gracilibacillus halophilus YIM-C55.5]